MRILPRPCGAVLALSLSCLPTFAQAPQSAAPPPTAPSAPAATTNTVAATVNGQAIPESAVQRSLQRVPPAQQAEMRQQFVTFLIDQVLLDQYLIQQKVAAEAKEIDKVLDDIKGEAKKENKDFVKELEQAKMTEAELREIIAADLRWDKYTKENSSDKVLKERFDSQKYLFDGTMVRARHILLSPASEQTAAQLKTIKQEINKQVADAIAKLPADTDNLAREKKRQSLLEEAFGAQAKAKSACPSKNKGGDVDWFQGTGVHSMVEPFSKVAFTITPFDISEPVKTPFGYHLILVTDRKPGREVKFEEVKEMVKDQYFTTLHQSIVETARQSAKIVVNSPK